MVRSKGMHRRSRDRLLMKLTYPEAIRRSLQSFKIDDSVVISPNPSIQKNIPHHRFFGVSGRVIGKKGRAYTVEIRQGSKLKHIDMLPEHLKRA